MIALLLATALAAEPAYTPAFSCDRIACHLTIDSPDLRRPIVCTSAGATPWRLYMPSLALAADMAAQGRPGEVAALAPSFTAASAAGLRACGVGLTSVDGEVAVTVVPLMRRSMVLTLSPAEVSALVSSTARK